MVASVALRHVQDVCIAQMADICRECDAAEGGTLFVIGAYGIGKERAFLGTARALGWKIWCEPEKVVTMRMLQLGGDSMGLLTEVRGAASAQPATVGRCMAALPSLCIALRKRKFCVPDPGCSLASYCRRLLSLCQGSFITGAILGAPCSRPRVRKWRSLEYFQL